MAISFILAIITGLVWAVWNRKRGSGHKTLALIFMSLCILVANLHALASPSLSILVWSIITIGVSTVASMLLLFRPSWGEIFPHYKNTFNYDYAPGVKPLANLIAGFDYTQEVAEADGPRELFWKMGAWVARLGLYGLPLASVGAYCSHSLAPLVVMPLASLCVGFIYLRCFLNRVGSEDWIANAERKSGAILGFTYVMSLC